MIEFLIVAASAIGLLWAGQRALIYFPSSRLASPAVAGLPRAQVVSYETADGVTLEGWFLPASRAGTGHTVVLFNGNAGNRGDRAELAAQLAGRGLSVFMVDYRGYGGNPGLPSEEGLARDARAALAYVAGREDVDPTRIVFFGESLGAAVAVRLALEYPPAALILRSPFSSLVEIGRHHYPFLPVAWLLKDRYASNERIGRISSPLLVVAGDLDRVVPYGDSVSIYEMAPHPKRLVTITDADHNDEALTTGAELVRAVVEFVEGVEDSEGV